MGRTHPQLPRSSDSHRILECKPYQRWLILMDPTFLAPSIQGTCSVVQGPPDLHHNPLWLCLSGLTETQEAEECGAHGSASVRRKVQLSKADWVTGCGRWAVLLVQSAGSCHMGRWPASSHSRDGSLTWAASWSTPHDPIVNFCFPKHCKPKRIQTDLAALWSRNSASVYTMQDAFPKLMINLININSSKKRNHMFPPHMSGSVQVAN